MDDEKERIRKEKIRKLKEEQEKNETTEHSNEKSTEEKIDELYVQATTSGARKRLNTVEMAKPELANEVKRQIAQVQAAGRLAEIIDEEKMGELLGDAHSQTKTDFDIKHR